ncbi:MAG: hypothetical protein U1E15_08160 [Hyphomicrobiales bacterium]
MQNGFVEAVVEFGDAVFKFGQLRQLARDRLGLFQPLGDVEDAAVHVGERAEVGPLRNTGGQLFHGAQMQHFRVLLGGGGFVNAAVEALDLTAQALDFSGRCGRTGERRLRFLEQAEDAAFDGAQFLLAGLHGLGLGAARQVLALAHLIAIGQIGDLAAQQVAAIAWCWRSRFLDAAGEIGEALFQLVEGGSLDEQLLAVRTLGLAAE